MLFNALFGGDLTVFLLFTLISMPGRLFSLSCHEWAHAYAAYRSRDPTAKNLGRMTLDPAKHIDPIGFIIWLFVGFGWAKPVPVNPRNFKKYVRDDIIVSLAGVTTNFILAFLFLGIAFSLALIFKISEIIFRL